jgi:anti-sigma regulatory factor (Ser/Thr protein kinase)
MHSLRWHTPPEQEQDPESTEYFSSVELRLPARSSELRRARECVSEAAAEFNFDPKASYEFVFAVNEAVTNAIKHGSPDKDGTIGLSIDAEGDTLVCSVCDCGPFVPPSTPPDMQSDEGGRGFAFMSALTDDFELSVEPDATVVRLRKRRTAGALVRNA